MGWPKDDKWDDDDESRRRTPWGWSRETGGAREDPEECPIRGAEMVDDMADMMKTSNERERVDDGRQEAWSREGDRTELWIPSLW